MILRAIKLVKQPPSLVGERKIVQLHQVVIKKRGVGWGGLPGQKTTSGGESS